MTFKEVLAQVIEWLQQDKRITYRALKRQFDLDDAYLDDLKAELIQAKQLAVDEDGVVLVWVGASAISAPISPLAQPTPQPAAQEQPSSQVTPRVPVSPPADAERRQLTVMFCDLVDSTTLSGQLDPEEYREVVHTYQSAGTEVIQRFDGHIAQLLGDGLLIYFGYPHAHEDDAQRAVRAGLGLLAAMRDLNTRLQQAKGFQLAVRVGIHTGVVVVGAMGDGGRQEQLALGEAPNVAARVQARAAPNTIAISGATAQLVQGYFQCQDLGAHTLRGVAEPIAMYRVLSESGVYSRLEVAQPRGLTLLVGRESEIALLLERWEQAKAGHGQVLVLTGDAGIGKSRLVQMLKAHIANEPHTLWECRSVSYFENTALFPLTDLFQRLLHFHAEDTPDEKFEKLERALSQYRLPLGETVPLFAPLLSLPIPEDRYPPLHISPPRQRQKTLETLVAIVQEHAERHPVLFIVEDLHWTDPTTLALLHLVIDQTPAASLLLVLTCRPPFQPAWHHRSYLTEITVHRLSPSHIEQIVHRITNGKTLPTEVLQQILAKTDGVPLFVEEMTKAILESGQLTAIHGHYELVGSFSAMTIPATLQDSLMARLDRLVTAKAIAQYAAVIGRQFSYALLHAVTHLDEGLLQQELGRLVAAEIVYQRGVPPQATYMFKHALIQDAAYQSLLKSTRQHYHRHIAQIVEAQFAELVETQPEVLAHHYTEAGLVAPAIASWQRAGQHALQRSANLEAIRHLTQGLTLLATLPETPARTQQELTLQVALGPALMATQGYGAPAVEHTYGRARALCQQVEATPQLAPVLFGLLVFYFVRAAYQPAQELGEQCLTLAHHAQDPALLLVAHCGLAQTSYCLGEFVRARGLFEQGLTAYDPQQHHGLAFVYGTDPAVGSHSWLAWTLWLLGYPDQAGQHTRAALALAQELGHALTLASARAWASTLHVFRREGAAAQAQAEATVRLATDQGLPFRAAHGTLVRGWAVAASGAVAEGLVQLQQGLDAWRATGAAISWPYWLSLLAEAYRAVGQTEAGLAVLAEALAVVDTTEERYWEAELHRLKGELLLARAAEQHAEAETSFQQALAIARRQHAKSLELRAAMSLSRLWQQQGKQAEARELLAPIYGWFTEGFDTADLQEARALLEELGG